LWDLTKKVSRPLLKSLVEIFRHPIDQKRYSYWPNWPNFQPIP
jgi:hypothetical protein